MTERERLVKQRDHLQFMLNQQMRGRLVPTKKAVEIKQAIDVVIGRIAELDREATDRLNLAKAPTEDILEVIAVPLLADVMNDFVAGVDGMLYRHGCQQTIFSNYTQQIRRASLAMMDTLAASEIGFEKLLDVDDTLVDALRKKILAFIKQRIHVNDKKR